MFFLRGSRKPLFIALLLGLTIACSFSTAPSALSAVLHGREQKIAHSSRFVSYTPARIIASGSGNIKKSMIADGTVIFFNTLYVLIPQLIGNDPRFTGEAGPPTTRTEGRSQSREKTVRQRRGPIRTPVV